MEPNTTLENLFKRYLNNACNDHEIARLLKYFGSSSEDELRHMINQALYEDAVEDIDQEHLSKLLINIKKNIHNSEPIKSRFLQVNYTARALYWAGAAAILLVLSFIFLTTSDNAAVQKVSKHNKHNEIVPGGNKATLILADGSRITLDDASKGEIGKEAGIKITKTADGQIVYTALNPNQVVKGTTINYNTIQTPVGGQYQINLPDGTKVWLNAESSLKYPTQFASNERRVELIGEGYFEVAKDKAHPFIVKTATQTVQVLGTHFNISSYKNEQSTKTTLVEGSVSVIQGDQSKLLHPGQQAIVGTNSFQIEKVDVESQIAWKDGYFDFKAEKLESIMKKLARWYDIDVIYQLDKDDPNLTFGGKVSRSKSINAVLNIMIGTGSVKFKVQGRKVIVMK